MNEGKKALIFSQFTSFLDLIAERFDAQGLRYYTITGSTPKKKRLELVDQFNADDTPAFLISLKAGNTGLNLTGASVVIHADPWWNAAAQDQATDRAHRIGQTEDVNVYQVVAKDTIEERILELQHTKSELARQFTDASLLADEAGTGASALTGSGETVTVFVTAQGSQLFSGREHLVVGLLSLLSAASLLPAVPACRIRPEGEARKPFQSPLLLVPVCCLVVRLVLTYRVVSVDPSLTDYYTELLAVVFLALAFYRLSSFAFRAGRTRRFAVYAALAIAFCLATLADRPDPARLLFYLGGAVTLFGFLLQRTAVLAAPWDNT